MHIELIDLLRCPEPHEETWLVAALNRMDGRDVVEAKLGCPVCEREFFIRDGIAIFDESAAGQTATEASADDPTTIAAFLNLVAPGKTVLLAGAVASRADELALLVDARVIALNPESVERPRSPQVGVIRAHTRVPLASKSLDGAALDAIHSTDALILETGRLLRPRGRLVAAANATLPVGFSELARDRNQIVAEYIGDLVTIRRLG